MLILAFETSAKAASVALLKDGALLAQSYENSGQTHSRTVMQMAADMLAGCGVTAQQIDVIAYANGPGSFTGIRIGAAAAKGFCWGRQLPCAAVSTLEAMVRGAAITDGVYCACMDARREQVYNALFRVCDGELTRLCEDRAIALAELSADLSAISEPVYLVGDGAQLCSDTLSATLPMLVLLPEHLRQQRAVGVALAAQVAAQQGKLTSAAGTAPAYLRLSQAERERLSRNQNEKGE